MPYLNESVANGEKNAIVAALKRCYFLGLESSVEVVDLKKPRCSQWKIVVKFGNVDHEFLSCEEGMGFRLALTMLADNWTYIEFKRRVQPK